MRAHEQADEVELYADPKVYDILHGPGTAEDVDAIERIERRWAEGAPEVWLEPACGSGRYLRVAAKRGRRVVGFDLSSGMIGYAQDRMTRLGLDSRASLFIADMCRFAERVEPGSIGVAFNLINTVRHLGTDRDVLRHFDEVARCLDTRGVYAVGISLTVFGLEPPSEDHWMGRRGRCEVVQHIQYMPPLDPMGDRREQVYSHVTVTRPSGETHQPSNYWLRAYDLDQWRDVIDRSCLTVRGVVDAEGVPCEPTAPGYAIWVLGREG
ncbi:MAG: class I SAM-dependent methyltransferase [Planctomycetota bacterium]